MLQTAGTLSPHIWRGDRERGGGGGEEREREVAESGREEVRTSFHLLTYQLHRETLFEPF